MNISVKKVLKVGIDNGWRKMFK